MGRGGLGGDMSVYKTLVPELQLASVKKSLYGGLDAIVPYMPKTNIYGQLFCPTVSHTNFLRPESFSFAAM